MLAPTVELHATYPNGKTALCSYKPTACATQDDGICDDGGPGSQFDECPYGTDCIDCCPRDPWWGFGSRYSGVIDTALDRAVCTQELIRIDLSSPCLNNDALSVEATLGNANLSRESATFFVVVIVIVFSLTVAIIMVPFSVYAQLVYSGHWPVLNWPQRIWCMLVGNYEAAGVARELKDKHKLWREASSLRLKKDDDASCSGKNRWFHMTRSWWQYVDPANVEDLEVEENDRARRRSTVTEREARHSQAERSSHAGEDDDSDDDDEELDFWEKLTFAVFFFPVVFFINIITWEVFFDVVPLKWDGLKARKVVKVLRMIAATYVLGLLLTYVPENSTSGLKETLECVFNSCKEGGWRRNAEELDCKSAKAVGLIQPCFWSDLLDVVEAALTLAVLTLLAEWRDTWQGKNEVGKDLLKKVDKEVGQEFHETLKVPEGPPKNPLKKTPPFSKEPPEESLQVLRDLRDEEHDETPASRQAQRVAAVNTAAPGAKLTMAQLYSAVGSLAAIVTGASDYHAQCVSNALLWSNETLAEFEYGNSTSDLELVLFKPDKHPMLTFASIVRATMSNLTLVTIGVAVKNFITRTAGGKACVNAMMNQRDKTEKDDDALHILMGVLMSLKNAAKRMFLKIAKLVYHKYDPKQDRRPAWLQTKSQPHHERDHEELLEKSKLDEAAKQNARSIIKVYNYSTYALLPITLWYLCAVLGSFFVAPFAIFQAFVLLTTVYLTLVPLLDFIADALRRGVDGDDRRRIDASMVIVKTVIVLRSCMILSQAAMLRSQYGHGMAAPMTWDSYWRSGDATEKLAYIFTFDITNIFNFKVNVLSKLLSFVVLGLELVAQIGSQLKATSTVRLFPRGCCQRSLVRFSNFIGKQQAMINKVQASAKVMQHKVEEMEEAGEISHELAPAELIELARPLLYKKLEEKLEPKLKKLCHKWKVTIEWDDVISLLEQIDTLEELQSTIQQAVEDPEAFLKRLAGAAKPAAKRLMLSRLRRPIEKHLCPDDSKQAKKNFDEQWKNEILPALERIATMQALQEALNSAMEDPKAFLTSLKDVAVQSGGKVMFPIAKRTLIDKIKPKLMPFLRDKGITVNSDVVMAVEVALKEINSIDDLQTALSDMRRFAEQLIPELQVAGRKYITTAQEHDPMVGFEEVKLQGADSASPRSPALMSGRGGSEHSVGAQVQSGRSTATAAGRSSDGSVRCTMKRGMSSTASLSSAPEI